MTNKSNEQKLNNIKASLESLRPENLIDREKAKERAEMERKILREIIENSYKNKSE